MNTRELTPEERLLLERAILLGPVEEHATVAQIPFVRVVERPPDDDASLQLLYSPGAPGVDAGSGLPSPISDGPVSTVYCRDLDGATLEVIVFAGEDGRLTWLEVNRYGPGPVQRFPTAELVSPEYPTEPS